MDRDKIYKEIEDAVHYAKSSAGWSTYINGLQIDYETFKDEMSRAYEHVRSMQAGNVRSVEVS